MTMASDRAAMRRRRKRLIAAGLCLGCGKVPPRPGHRLCADCAQKATARAMRRFNRRKAPCVALGICTRCGTRQSMPGVQICGLCSERGTSYKASLRAHYQAEGRCACCGHERDREDRALCATCRQARRSTKARHKDAA